MSTVESVPQKVCSRCGAMNRTASKRCPSCNRKYKRRTGLKVFLGFIAGAIIVIILIVVLIAALASGVSKQLNAEQARHAISRHQFRQLSLGMTEQQVRQQVGRRPEDRQEFHNKSFLGSEPQNSSCVYYNRKGGDFGDVFQLCFTNGKLHSKNAY